MRRIADLCASEGGRVHLVKHVFADPTAMEAMYRRGVEELREQKLRLDPENILTNEFLRRVFPSLAAPEETPPDPAT